MRISGDVAITDMIVHELDAIDLRCPELIVLAKQKVGEIPKGDALLIMVTDPSFAIDCQVYVKQSGNKLLKSWQEGEVLYYLLKKEVSK